MPLFGAATMNLRRPPQPGCPAWLTPPRAGSR